MGCFSDSSWSSGREWLSTSKNWEPREPSDSTVLKPTAAILKRKNASKGAELMRFKPQLWDMARYEFNSHNWGLATPKTKKKSAPSGLTEFYDIVFPGSR